MERMTERLTLLSGLRLWLSDNLRERGVLGSVAEVFRQAFYLARDYTPARRRLRYGDLDYDFEHAGARADLPQDDFSIRWDTCLAIEAPIAVQLQLVSDDGSRLWIDGTERWLEMQRWRPCASRDRVPPIHLPCTLTSN